MNALLALSTLLLASQVFAAAPPSTPVAYPARYRLGGLLRNLFNDGSVIESAVSELKYKATNGNETRLASGYVKAYISSPTKRVTKYTYKKTADVKPEIAKSGACFETKLMSFASVAALTKDSKIAKYSIIIVTDEIDAAKFENASKINLFQKEHLTLGFLKRNAALNETQRDLLNAQNIPFFENLVLPEGFDVKASAAKTFYSFKFVFGLFYNETSVYKSEKAANDVKINLADLTLFESDDKLAKYCKEDKMKAKIALLSYDLSAYEEYPVDKLFDKPAIMYDDKNKEIAVRFPTHLGTHLVAPYRFDQTKTNVTKLPETTLFAPCYKIKIPAGDSKVDNSKITKDIISKALTSKTMPKDAIVVLETGYAAKHWNHPEGYLAGYPTLDIDAAKFLVESYNVKAIAIDTRSLDTMPTDPKTAVPMPVHEYLAAKDIPTIVSVKVEEKTFSADTKNAICAITYIRSEESSAAPAALFVLPDLDVATTTALNTLQTKKAAASTIESSWLVAVAAIGAVVARM